MSEVGVLSESEISQELQDRPKRPNRGGRIARRAAAGLAGAAIALAGGSLVTAQEASADIARPSSIVQTETPPGPQNGEAEKLKKEIDAYAESLAEKIISIDEKGFAERKVLSYEDEHRGKVLDVGLGYDAPSTIPGAVSAKYWMSAEFNPSGKIDPKNINGIHLKADAVLSQSPDEPQNVYDLTLRKEAIGGGDGKPHWHIQSTYTNIEAASTDEGNYTTEPNPVEGTSPLNSQMFESLKLQTNQFVQAAQDRAPLKPNSFFLPA